MTPTQQRFIDKTHIDPDYFLWLVLKTLGFIGVDDLGQGSGRILVIEDIRSNREKGYIDYTPDTMTIRRY